MQKITQDIAELHSMKKYPKQLFYSGNLELLTKRKISIVGSRKPTKYARENTIKLSSQLAKYGFCVVSGGAMGIDATAHSGAGAKNTIAILPCGIDIKYPKINKNLLTDIENQGLLLSQFEPSSLAKPWSFVVRNELVVALGEVLVVAEAEIDSGTMRSVEFALKMQKDIYVFAHRMGESSGTNLLLQNNQAKAIYDIDFFIQNVLQPPQQLPSPTDPFTLFCQTNPSYEECVTKFPSQTFEAELSGEIMVKNGKVILLQ
ncbi:SMF family protein, DNA processing chain A (dprA) [hydrothermal vent metagenome]|uniref:SMF family protein, DNA processing chain A (DprA) n=1 Tax=hydrothermal vent metagenome TaxID=652676 RepID=A0A1W1D5P8_9ZZZZ